MLLTTPSQQSDRAVILDVLRGIAIFGILLNNIYAFSGYAMLPDEMREQMFSTFKIDMVLNLLQIIFVEGKFYTLFSLLFGIGFSIFLSRGERKNRKPLLVFYRRIIILILIGAAHLYFLWPGDILLLYGLLGLLLPLFRNVSNRSLLILAVIFILSPIAIDILKIIFKWSPWEWFLPTAIAIDTRNGVTPETFGSMLFESRDFGDLRKLLDSAYLYRWADLLDNNRLFKVMGIFLLGLYLGRNQIYAKLEEYRPLIRKVRKCGFMFGVPFCIAMGIFEGDDHDVPRSWWGLADTITYAFGVVPLSLAYTATITLWWIRKKEKSRLNLFAPTGRMALTNYIMQTIIASAIFYGVGLGLGQEFGLTYIFLFAIGIYLLQVLYSGIWLKYFQYGPLEWIWRMLTYGKWLRLSRSNGTGNPRS